jgi:hypothetical protein
LGKIGSVADVRIIGAAESTLAKRGPYKPRESKGGVMKAAQFDWHSDRITRRTPVTAAYRNTQNVRRFLKAQCGVRFRFDRPFMRWIKDGTEKTMGDVADEWLRRRQNSN